MGLSLMGFTATVYAAAHKLYDAKPPYNYVQDISSGALMCPQSATGVAWSTNSLQINNIDGTKETSRKET